MTHNKAAQTLEDAALEIAQQLVQDGHTDESFINLQVGPLKTRFNIKPEEAKLEIEAAILRVRQQGTHHVNTP